jgi:hypothetical protein
MESRAAGGPLWSAEDPLFAADLMWDAQRLTALDDLWTSFLAVPDIGANLESNLPLLRAMVGDMVGSLTSITERTDRLERLIDYANASNIDLDAELDRVLRRAQAEVDLPRPFVSLVHDACRVLREESSSETDAVTAKLARLSELRYEPGDWSLKVKKALLIVAVAAGILVAITIPGALVVPVAVSVGAGVVAVVASGAVAWDSLPAA